MSAADGPTYITTDNVRVPEHARVQWGDRFPGDERRVSVAWRAAQPVVSRRAPRHSAVYARALGDPPALLLALGDQLLTALYVALEPGYEQRRWLARVDGMTQRGIERQARRIDRGVLPDPRENGGRQGDYTGPAHAVAALDSEGA